MFSHSARLPIDVDTVLLTTFIEVARHRHFGRAAAALCVTQSAVSARVKQLESSLGVTLFERRRNDIQLTEAGHRLLRHAAIIVDAYEQACADLRCNGGACQALALGCHPDLWPLWQGRQIRRLRELYPHLRMRVELQTDELLFQQLSAHRLDLILVAKSACGDRTGHVPVAAMDLQMVSTRAGQTLARALGEDYLLIDWGGCFMRWHAERFADLQPGILQLSQGWTGFDLLCQIGGAAYLPEPLVAPALARGDLFAVTDAPRFPYGIQAAVRAEAPNRAFLDDIIRILVETAP